MKLDTNDMFLVKEDIDVKSEEILILKYNGCLSNDDIRIREEYTVLKGTVICINRLFDPVKEGSYYLRALSPVKFKDDGSVRWTQHNITISEEVFGSLLNRDVLERLERHF